MEMTSYEELNNNRKKIKENLLTKFPEFLNENLIKELSQIAGIENIDTAIEIAEKIYFKINRINMEQNEIFEAMKIITSKFNLYLYYDFYEYPYLLGYKYKNNILRAVYLLADKEKFQNYLFSRFLLYKEIKEKHQ